ncbi:MAG: hypothetical protein JXB47_08705 [Anaerolineae bacterium]|nr:hypothetical protein [Anaerolineae bacterium]
MSEAPDFLTHYYERAKGPFLNLSDLPREKAEQVLDGIRRAGRSFASRRAADYLEVRRALEDRVRRLFIEKGGRPRRARPHYMILGACPWLEAWYIEGCALCIPLARFSADIVSFTYGDTFPAMRLADGRPYRGQVYTLDELTGLVRRCGLPQDWNADGSHGPERYIEAQVWDDEPLRAFLVK